MSYIKDSRTIAIILGLKPCCRFVVVIWLVDWLQSWVRADYADVVWDYILLTSILYFSTCSDMLFAIYMI